MSFIVLATLDLAEAFGCLLAADFTSGVMHWAEDTWLAPGRSAILDAWVVRDNLEHHRRPGSIRSGSYWSTNRAGLVVAAAVSAGLIACGVHAWQAYLFLALASHANQVHRWAHSAQRPWPVRALQAIGLLQSRRHHGGHHVSPFAVRYCSVTDYLNPILDRSGFWRAVERCGERAGLRVQRASAARGGY